jgi:predicted nucleic acid-binding protein
MRRGRRTSSAWIVTAGSVVLDASVLIRSAVAGEPTAQEWMRAVEAGTVDAHVPEVVHAEVVSALIKYVRAKLVAPDLGAEIVRGLAQLPLTAHGHGGLAPASFALALEHGLSAYDASYLALARALDAPLVTADRRLASVAPGAELIP